MLGKFFLQILNMSLTAGVMILAVVLIRLLLRKAPKIFSYCLWAVVLFRLICPVSFSSPVSLLGTLGAETSKQGSMTYISEDFLGGSGTQSAAENPMNRDALYGQQPWDDIDGWGQSEGLKQLLEKSAENPETWSRSVSLQKILWHAELSAAMKVSTLIWLMGILGFAVYSMVSVRKWKGSLRSAKEEFKKGNIRVFRTGKVTVPFVTGFFRPRIYLPEDMEWQEQSYILLHERIHIRRGDHLWRILAYAALCLHWFNPLVWAAFYISERDMEMSCDEAVIRKFGSHIKKAYSTSLLTMSAGSRVSHGISPAFAEGDTGSRIRNVLYYKKPAVILVGAAVVISVLAAVFLLGNPENAPQDDQVQDIEIFYNADEGEADHSFIPSAENDAEEKSKAEEEEKIVITLALVVPEEEGATSLMQEAAYRFNKKNEKYYVELRTCHYGAELGTMRDRLAVEVGAGDGPDIMTADVFPVTQAIMDSGVLADLTPYMEASGITPEIYFPAYAAAVSGDRIYGIRASVAVEGFSVAAEVLGEREPPKDVEGLVDLLLEYQGHGSFYSTSFGGRYILRDLLSGSEDLWGMIDWEEKTCDFTGPFFSKLLDMAKRYREDGIKGYEPVVYSYYIDMYNPPSLSIPKFCPGSVPVGYFFDDGSHYKYTYSDAATVVINANTEHLEGAYAFVSYLLSRGGQDAQKEPVNKELWNAKYENLLDLLRKIPDHPYIPPLNEETRQETLGAIGDARYVPRRAEAIRDIIYEEAEGYIEGDRSKEDVIRVIQNRAQLYLDEQG